MKEEDKQYDIIVDNLKRRGAFAISELEWRTDTSRSWLNKLLHGLVDDNILIMTFGSGAGVRYKLANNKTALAFLFRGNDNLTIDELAQAWGVGIQSAKKNIKAFVDSGIAIKQGTPPKKILYSLARQDNDHGLSDEQKQVIDKYYAYVTPDGRLLKGVYGFLYWAENKSGRRDFGSLAQEYLNTRRKFYDNKDKVFLIDATEKIRQVFGNETRLTKLFHRDFDALPVFGKTYLSQMIRIAKAGRTNAAVMNYIVDNIRDSIRHILDEYDIDAIGFIPPTVMRKTQLMTFIAKKLRVGLPVIPIDKYKALVPVQQKSLKKVEDRVQNASKTIVISDSSRYDHVLLIDDVTGSGATLNETAKKLLDSNIAKKVYGFTVTGSAKANDFEVISEA